ncbi:MAG: hypothetical protein MI723_13730, partial [Caulobacterales bacterium]|nr:hypothetical protein [Caulobacterales bacterium]
MMVDALALSCTTSAVLPLPVWSTVDELCAAAGAAMARAAIDAPARMIFFILWSSIKLVTGLRPVLAAKVCREVNRVK